MTKALASIFVIAVIGFAHAEDAPKQTNAERGMLKFGEAFGQQPKIKLCEVTEDGKVRLRTCSNRVKNAQRRSDRQSHHTNQLESRNANR